MSTAGIATSSSAVLRLITAAALFVSEPHPSMFGNGANESPSINKAWTNHNWLKSRFHFSFAEYGNPANDQFGVLRVANDDLVQPARGFGTHPHANMEICTYIVDGELTHQDSTTNVPQTVTRGGVQFMSAGSGVRHSEHNRRSDRDLRFIQLWILPRKRRGQSPPRYGQYVPPSVDERLNQFVHLVGDASNAASGAPIGVDQDVNIYAAEIDHGRSAALTIAPGRQAYCLFLEGARTRASLSSALGDEATMVGELPSVVGKAHDGLEVVVRPDCDAGPQRLTFANEVEDAAASEGSDISRRRSHVLVIEMAYDPRAHGRRDLS